MASLLDGVSTQPVLSRSAECGIDDRSSLVIVIDRDIARKGGSLAAPSASYSPA